MTLRRLIQINFNRGFVTAWLALTIGLVGTSIFASILPGKVPMAFAVICIYGGYFTLFYIIVGLWSGHLMDFLFRRVRD